MPITRAALQAPAGALTPELLLALRSLVAGATVAEDVADAYASVGNAKVVGWADAVRANRAAAAWGHYRALMDRAQQIYNAAKTLATDGTSRGQSDAAGKALEAQAETFLAEYLIEQAAEFPSATVPSEFRGSSRSTRAVIAW